MAVKMLNISDELVIETDGYKNVIGFLNAQVDIDLKNYNFNIQIINKELYLQNIEMVKVKINEFEALVKTEAINNGWSIFTNN